MPTPNTPEPSAAPAVAPEATTAPAAGEVTPDAAQLQAFRSAMQSAEDAVAEAVRRMGESHGT